MGNYECKTKTRTKSPNRWTSLSSQAEAAFEELKQLPSATPVLVLPRRAGAYTLHTDASAGQIGVFVLQEQSISSTRSLGYWSRTLITVERDYSTTERKCLAVVLAVLIIRPYVEEMRFTVRNDSAVLK